MSTLFLIFSIVFPNTALFINLKKSFSKSVVPFVRKSVLTVELNVFSQPRFLGKFNSTMDFS
jgi:hypothetical protein